MPPNHPAGSGACSQVRNRFRAVCSFVPVFSLVVSPISFPQKDQPAVENGARSKYKGLGANHQAFIFRTRAIFSGSA